MFLKVLQGIKLTLQKHFWIYEISFTLMTNQYKISKEKRAMDQYPL